MADTASARDLTRFALFSNRVTPEARRYVNACLKRHGGNRSCLKQRVTILNQGIEQRRLARCVACSRIGAKREVGTYVSSAWRKGQRVLCGECLDWELEYDDYVPPGIPLKPARLPPEGHVYDHIKGRFVRFELRSILKKGSQIERREARDCWLHFPEPPHVTRKVESFKPYARDIYSCKKRKQKPKPRRPSAIRDRLYARWQQHAPYATWKQLDVESVA